MMERRLKMSAVADYKLSRVFSDRDISIEAKAIYAYIHAVCGWDNGAEIEKDEIYKDLNISERRFYKHRRSLISKGYIEVLDNKFTIATYILN